MPIHELGFTAEMDNDRIKVTLDDVDGFIFWVKHFDSVREVKKLFAEQIKKGIFFDETNQILPKKKAKRHLGEGK
jgi:hypothetical protein